MATSDRPLGAAGQPEEAYVWVWLPDAIDPVVAGIVWRDGARIWFRYADSYLALGAAISLYAPELPLTGDAQAPVDGLVVAGCLNDAGPDSWGQRVILHCRFAAGAARADVGDLHPITYFLESGSGRPGGLDFQASATEYVPRTERATLTQLVEGAALVEAGEKVPAAIEAAIIHGSSAGGARPKVLIEDGDRKLIAKLQSSRDKHSVVKAEAVAMELARRVGLDAAGTRLTAVGAKDVLLVERFDRPGGGRRRLMISALTIQRLDELGYAAGSYVELADELRRSAPNPGAALRELFARIAFNIHVGNIDDHPRNHAAFWDGERLELTPAYDIEAIPRAGRTAEQAMAYDRDGNRWSRTAPLIAAADLYLLDHGDAKAIVEHQRTIIEEQWTAAADACALSPVDRNILWRRAVLNPFVDE